MRARKQTKRSRPERTAGAASPPAVKQNDALAAASIAVALQYLGVKEATGNNDGPDVKMFQDYVGKWVEGQSWCAAFASFCIGHGATKLGIKPVFKTSASSTEIYHEAKAAGTLLAHPVPYCVGLLRGNGGSPGKDHHHTFRVLTVDLAAGVVHGIDGNWSNSVCKTVHPISMCDFVAVC